MDMKYSFNKSDYLAVNLDNESTYSTDITITILSQTFSTTYKTYWVWSGNWITGFRILNQDAYSKRYCAQNNTKSSINLITAWPWTVHTTICDNWLRWYIDPVNYPTEYNNNDIWKRVSIAIK